MFRTALRNVLAHKARLLMTALAVVLGVAFAAGSLVFSQTRSGAAAERASAGYDRIAVNIGVDAVPDGSAPTGLDERLAARLARIPGVAHAANRVDGSAAVADRDGRLLGAGDSHLGSNYAPGPDGTDAAYRFTAGRGPAHDDEIALDTATAAQGGYRVGDRVRVGTGQSAATYRLCGVFGSDGHRLTDGGTLTLFTTRTAQRLFAAPGHVQSIELTAKSGTAAPELADRVGPLLPKGASAVTGATLGRIQANLASGDDDTMGQILLGFSLVALFVAAFLISNTFTMLIGRRARELALLRLLGASGRQVRRILLAESALVGAVSSALGLAVGTGVAAALNQFLGTSGAPAAPLVLSPATLLGTLLLGTAVTVVAAWLPARRAMAIAPVTALTSSGTPAPATARSRRTAVGAVLTALGILVVVYGAVGAGRDARTVIGVGTLFAVVGVLGLIPLLARPFVALLRPPLLRLSPVHGVLATRNTTRDPRRTGATAAALTIALALASGLSVLGASADRYLERATTHDFTADYLVEPAVDSARLTAANTKAAATVPGAAVSGLDQSTGYQLGGRSAVLTGVDPDTVGRLMRYDLVDGTLDSLTRGQIAVADYKAEEAGWHVGQTLPVRRGGTSGRVTIGAVYRADPQSNLLPSITAANSLVARYDRTPRTHLVLVATDGGASPAAYRALRRALGDDPALSVLDRRAVQDEYSGGIGDQLDVFYALLTVAALIAGLGVTNTLALSVLERQKEIGVLRAVGLDRGQITRMIRWEALIVGAFGAVLGTVLGVFLGWALGRTLQESVAGYTLVLPWGRLTCGIAVAMTVALLASLWPARKAARVAVTTATAAD
ncbi:ABC transporter permease [Streptomyces atriruber]|uniref:ABC transporter permease n=1 Tax=Streptomyces atriruber TaxID=545121 RepID=UPI0006E41FC5|nr:FtsX-like permease family protein [Streptomyces atriruber]